MNIEESMNEIYKIYQKAFIDEMNRSLFIDIKIPPDPRSKAEKIFDSIRWKFGELRLWLGEKIAGRSLDDYYY